VALAPGAVMKHTKTILLLLLGLCLQVVQAEPAKVVVMTSYPQEMLSRYQAAFEAAHPDIDLVFEWRRSNDAWKLMQTPQGAAVDVYWAPTLDTFVSMADKNLFATLDLPLKGVPGRVGQLDIDDAKHRFAAFEIAGFGFALSQTWLDAHKLPAPRDWNDLTDVRYHGAILMPVPSRQGFSPMIYESILQGLGWEQGWSVISAIAANSELMGNGGGAFIDDIAAAKHGVALSIDFFPKSAQANGQAVQFRYATTTLFSPAYVARMQAAPHPEQAKAFIEWAMSDAGQALLLHRDVARLPVRPTAYKADAEYNPFAPANRIPGFDFLQAGPQISLMSALFDVQITKRYTDLVAATTKLRQAEQQVGGNAAAKAKLEQAKTLLNAPPVTAMEAKNLLQKSGSTPAPGGRISPDSYPVQAWTQLLSSRMTEALALIDSVNAGR